MNKIQFENEVERLPGLIREALLNRYNGNVEITITGNQMQARLDVHPNLYNAYKIQIYNVYEDSTVFKGLYILKIVFFKGKESLDPEKLTLDFGPGTQDYKWRQIFLDNSKKWAFNTIEEKTSEELSEFLCRAY